MSQDEIRMARYVIDFAQAAENMLACWTGTDARLEPRQIKMAANAIAKVANIIAEDT
jgi:hypothetical protein